MTQHRTIVTLPEAAARVRCLAVWAALLMAPLAADLPAQELQADLRTWTSRSGKSSTRARLWKVTEEDGQRRVHLMKEGGFGESFSMSWKSLSPADIAYVERVTKDRRAALETARDELGELRRHLSSSQPAGSPAIGKAALERIEFLASELLLVDATNAAALEAMAIVAALEKRTASAEHLVAQCRLPVTREAPVTAIGALPEELRGMWLMQVRSGDGGATCEHVEENLRPAASLRCGATQWQSAGPTASDSPHAFRLMAKLAAVDELQTHMMILSDDTVWIVHGPTPEKRVLLRKLDSGLDEISRAVFHIEH